MIELEKEFKNVVIITNNQITLEIRDKSYIPNFIKNLITKNAMIYEVKILDGLEEWFLTITDEKTNHEY